MKWILFSFFLQSLYGAETILITGASGKLGTLIAEQLAPDYNLILADCDSESIKVLQKRYRSLYPHVYRTMTFDYLNPKIGTLPKLKMAIIIVPKPKGEQIVQKTFEGPCQLIESLLPNRPDHLVILLGLNSTKSELASYGEIKSRWEPYVNSLIENGCRVSHFSIDSSGYIPPYGYVLSQMPYQIKGLLLQNNPHLFDIPDLNFYL